jgi:hypothetical protein
MAVMLTLTINAITNANTNDEFDGSLTVITQYLEGYHNVNLRWEDSSPSTNNFAYIITSGNSENEENYVVNGYTSDRSFAIYNRPNLLNISNQYNVYRLNFNQNVDLSAIIPNDNGTQLRVALTWSQIKELLKKKSNNIWKIRRNNIPTDLY